MLAWVVGWAIRAALLFGMYLLFSGQASASELVIGGIFAALGAGLALLVRWAGGVRFRFRAPWLHLLRGLVVSIPRDVALVGWRLLRGASRPGRLAAAPFDPGGDTPEAAFRRAAVFLVRSVAPNEFVLTLSPEWARVQTHRLAPTNGSSRDPEWPV